MYGEADTYCSDAHKSVPWDMVWARGWGLRSISAQVKLTVIAVNIKRIAALIANKDGADTTTIQPISQSGAKLPRFAKLNFIFVRKLA